MSRGGVNCIFFSKWICQLKQYKFLWFKYYGVCIKDREYDTICKEQVKRPKPKSYPPAPPVPHLLGCGCRQKCNRVLSGAEAMRPDI